MKSMSNIRIEKWLDNEIRFVEHQDEWWAIAKDIADALCYSETNAMTRHLKDKYLTSVKLTGMNQRFVAINEFGIYKAIMRSQRPEAEEFEEWIYNMLKELRKATGLEGFQIFRMLDKDQQKEMMETLRTNLDNPNKISYIKANTISNKAVSKAFGYDKSIKKADMTPEMLVKRQAILNDTVELMTVNEKYGIGLSVSENIYNKHCK
jgi:prophage antirepressor-like protein